MVVALNEAAAGTPAACMTSFANAFDPSSRAAARTRAEDGDAGVAERVGDARDERRLRADDDQVGRQRAGQRGDAVDVEHVHGVACRQARDAGVAGRGVQLGHRGRAGERGGQRVLAAAGADDQDDHATPTLSGARIWSRRGPTPTSVTGSSSRSSTQAT